MQLPAVAVESVTLWPKKQLGPACIYELHFGYVLGKNAIRQASKSKQAK
jgi:hypothetical protein